MIALTKQQEKLTSFNRTFMELKCIQPSFQGAPFVSFNRTFMELK